MTTLRIAVRYLFGKKSHSAVNTIALVSLCGIAIATAAMVCVLSVFNGFREVLGEKLDTLTPEIQVTPKEGKMIADADSIALRLSREEGVAVAQTTLTDQALALFNGREMPVVIKGVSPALYRRTSGLDTLQIEGSEPLGLRQSAEDPAPASLSIGTAWQLGPVQLGQSVLLFAPRRFGRINMANPMGSFEVDSVRVAGVFQTGQTETDDNMLITDIAAVRELLQYEEGVGSAVEVTLQPGVKAGEAVARISALLGPEFDVKDRLAQHEVNFRMVQIEKWVTFLLLVFILIIASFNVVSTLSMLVLEKRETIGTLRAVGMTRRRIGRIFAWESWLVAIGGGVAGLILGSLLCLVQQQWGLIKLNGDSSSLILTSYPVSLELPDLGLTMVPILLIGWGCAMTASAYARRLSRE